jgi:hypothetical protein
MPDPAPRDPLDELRERLGATQAAAERLAGEAAGAMRAAAEGRVPAQGWAVPEDRAARQEEAQAVLALLGALRELIPPELQAQLTEVVRQVLLLVRALVDWWVERLDPERPPPAARADENRLQDIPIA